MQVLPADLSGWIMWPWYAYTTAIAQKRSTQRTYTPTPSSFSARDTPSVSNPTGLTLGAKPMQLECICNNLMYVCMILSIATKQDQFIHLAILGVLYHFVLVVISPPLVYSQHTSWFNHHKEDDHDNESNRTNEQEGKLKTTNLKGTSGNTDELFIRQPLEIIAPLIPSLPSFLLFLFVFIIIHRSRQNNGKGWPSLITRRMGAGQEVDMVEVGGIGPNIK